MLVLGTKDAGDAEEVAVEAEGGEEVAGVVGEAGGFGEGGRDGVGFSADGVVCSADGVGFSADGVLGGGVVEGGGKECGEGIRAARLLCG